ncbi:MAG: RNA polymerase sigma factor [Elusimicrobia bacterium]|nr:RNA polymerase sigma factor [Elusimicrobiota bacterium]
MLDISALERFVDEYGDHAYSFALGLTGNEADARELVQDAFVKIFDKAARYDPAQSLESWFLTVMKHIHFDSRRRAERRLGVSLDAPLGESGLTVADTVADAAEEAVLTRLERAEDGARVRRALAALTPDSRAVLLLVDVDGMSYEDAGRALGVPLNTVRSRIVRARGFLRERLAEMEVAA